MEPLQPSYIKTKNRQLVLNLFREKNLLSRAEIARLTGMSFPTVLKIVDKLIELNIVIELEETEQFEGAGRKGHLLEFNPKSYYAIGIVAEGNEISAGLIDMSGQCSHKISEAYTSDDTIPDINCIKSIIDRLRIKADEEKSSVLGLCYGLPVVINPNNNNIVHLHEADIFEEAPVTKIYPDFYKVVSLPCYLENDVKLKCKGEAFLRRRDESFKNLLYISIGTGCGAGIYLDGHVWHGMNFKSGEIGETLLNTSDVNTINTPDSRTFENLINLKAIKNKFNIDLQNTLPTEKQAEEISDYIIPYMQLLLYNLANILDLKQCIITGIIPKILGEVFYDKLRLELSNIMPTSERLCVMPSISSDADLVGAAVTVFSHKLEDLLSEK